MISVEFESVGAGTCGWCRKERPEVYDVAFSDKSFVGPMCKNDLLRAVEMKIGAPAPIAAPAAKPEPRPAPAVPLAAALGNGPK
jgi:hypothetical protein